MVHRKAGELFEMKLGKMLSAKNYTGKQLRPYLRNVNVQWGALDLSDVKKMDFSEDEFAIYRLEKGDILVCEGGEVGRTAIYNGEIDDCCYQNAIHRLRVKNGLIDPEYFVYFMRHAATSGLIRRQTSTATIPHFTAEKFREFEVPVPRVETQHRIAFVLGQVDCALQKRREANQLTEQSLQSTFLEMFGDPVRNERGWETDSLEKMVLFKGGGTPSKSKPEYYHGTIPWVSPKDMKSLLIYSALDKITQEAIEESATNRIPRNSVLVVVRSGILKNVLPIAVNKVDVAINQDMKALICSKDLDPIFLLFLLRECSRVILQSVRATTADNISVDVLKHLVIILPPIELQRKFSKLFDDVEKLQLKQRISEIELEKLFQSLMQRYFG